MKAGDVRQWLLDERMCRDRRAGRRIACDQQQVRFLRRRTSTNLVQESHRVRRVRQRREAGGVERGDQQAGGDADRFVDVVILVVVAGPHPAPPLREDADQPCRVFEIGLVAIGAERRERGAPVRRGLAALVELALLGFGGGADPRLQRGRADGGEEPRLMIRPAGSRSRSGNAGFDHRLRHRPVGEVAARVAASDFSVEQLRPTQHLGLGMLDEVGKGYAVMGLHAGLRWRMCDGIHRIWGIHRMRSFVVGLLLVTAAPALAAPAKFEPADLYKLSMVTDPKVSPDGTRVLFTRASFDIQTDSRQGEIWLATIGGKTVTKALLIPAGAKAGPPEWSPDGKRIAWVAPWLGKPQVWVMEVAQGVGRPITLAKAVTPVTPAPTVPPSEARPFAPEAIAWSPNGRSIAFTARVETPPVKLAGMVEKPDGATWAPSPRIIDAFRYRGDGSGYVTGVTQLFVVDAGGGVPRQLTKGDADQVSGGFDWTPDSQALLFSARVRPGNETLPSESDVWRVAASGGAAVRVTSIDGTEDDPQVSPDGKTLAFNGFTSSSAFFIQPELWVMPMGGGAARNLTRTLDRPIINAKWTKDGKGLYAFYNDAGFTRVALVPLGGGAPTVVVPQVGGTRLYLPSSGGGWSEGTGTFAYTTVEADRPAGIGIARGGREITRIDFNADWRAGKTIGKLEHVTWTSSKGGLPIDGWVQYPPDFDPAKKYPLALEIHGGPNTDYGPYFSITHQIYAAAGYIVLFSNPRGSIGYGYKFANAIDKAYPGDDHADLMSGVDEMLKRPYVDARNQFIGGGSGGGVLTTNAIARTDRFRAAAALRPVTDWTVQGLTSDITAVTLKNWVPGTPWDNHDDYWRRSTLSMVGSVKTPTILIDGEADWRTPIGQSEAYYQALKFRGIDTRLVRMPEAGHGMGRPSQWLTSILAVTDWYARYLVK